METAESMSGGRASFAIAALQQVRDEMFELVSVLAGALGILLLLLATDSFRPRTWVPALTLLGGVGLAHVTARHHREMAMALLSTSMLLATVLASAVYGDVYVGGALALAIMVSGVLLSPRHPVGIAIALSCLTVVENLPIAQAVLSHSAVADAIDGASLALTFVAWTSAGVTWLISRPIWLALTWSWQAYSEADTRTRALRVHQGELNQALHQLDDACFRLERANEELARARQAAEEARRLKAEFAATISHELRTPLNLIVGLSEMILLGPTNQSSRPGALEHRDDVEIIYRNACQIANLVDDVLDLSQIDAHRLALEKQSVRLSDLVAEVVAMVGSLFRHKGLELLVDVPPELPSLFVDPNRVRQVLINLLNNSVRFTNEGGVHVRAIQGDNEIVVSVADTGIGISTRDLPHVFREFRQVGVALSHRYGGSGFGLYISKRFVELHGGTMWVESQEGEGTTFRFTLPLTPLILSEPVPLGWDRLTRAALSREVTVGVFGSPRAVRVFQRYLDGYQVVGLSPTRLDDLWQHPPHAVIIADSSLEADSPLRQKLAGLVAPSAGDAPVPVIDCPLGQVAPLPAETPIVDYLVKPVTRDRLMVSLRQLGHHVHNVLVVDDDPDMARLIAQMVNGAGRRYHVTIAYEGAEALRSLREAPPDALLLDILMPGIDGHAVLREMRVDDRLRAIPTIVVSAPSQRDDGIIAGRVVLGRDGGLTVGQAMRLVKAGLDLLFPATRAQEADPALPGASLD